MATMAPDGWCVVDGGLGGAAAPMIARARREKGLAEAVPAAEDLADRL